jgi:FKBP-type peptidyl-prolyl cis-trans isomerase FklB
MDHKNQKDRLSYAVGVQIAENLVQNGFEELEPQALVEGIIDIVKDQKLQITMEEVSAVINAHYEDFKSRARKENAAVGEQFLKKNKEKEGVVQLESGLQYRVIRSAEGAKPGLHDTVTTHYEGRTIEGTVFDSSFQRGESAQFPVNGVIPGWTEALQMMSVGEKWELVVPHHLAYGERGAGPDIPPYSTLIFDVELLAIH